MLIYHRAAPIAHDSIWLFVNFRLSLLGIVYKSYRHTFPAVFAVAIIFLASNWKGTLSILVLLGEYSSWGLSVKPFRINGAISVNYGVYKEIHA